MITILIVILSLIFGIPLVCFLLGWAQAAYEERSIGRGLGKFIAGVLLASKGLGK